MDERRLVYVLRSERVPGRHYVGLTVDVRSRLADHNAGRSAHTAKHGPWRLAAPIEFETTALAAEFERYLKSGSGRAFAKRHFERREPGQPISVAAVFQTQTLSNRAVTIDRDTSHAPGIHSAARGSPPLIGAVAAPIP